MIASLRKPIALSLITVLTGSFCHLPLANAQSLPWIPTPGVRISLSVPYIPAHLNGLTIHPDDPFRFDFLIHQGDEVLNNDQKEEEYQKLVKYFLASLTVADTNQWVNLSPYEKNRIIEEDFGKTQMGRDLLAQDYVLKQMTASLMYPEDKLGKDFWDKVYARAQKELGTTEIPMNTFNKVWIVADKATLYEKENTVYVIENSLKVMMEEDYLSLEKNSAKQSLHTELVAQEKLNKGSSISSRVVKEIIIPELQREVNEGKNFAALRQIYSGMILSTWYKRALKESLLAKIYADKSKVEGVNNDDPQVNEKIYQQYLAAYKKGVFNYIKEDVDKITKQPMPRKYFSGGAINDFAMRTTVLNTREQLSEYLRANRNRGVEGFNQTDKVDVQLDRAEAIKDRRILLADGAMTAAKVVIDDTIRNPHYKEPEFKRLNEKYGAVVLFLAPKIMHELTLSAEDFKGTDYVLENPTEFLEYLQMVVTFSFAPKNLLKVMVIGENMTSPNWRIDIVLDEAMTIAVDDSPTTNDVARRNSARFSDLYNKFAGLVRYIGAEKLREFSISFNGIRKINPRWNKDPRELQEYLTMVLRPSGPDADKYKIVITGNQMQDNRKWSISVRLLEDPEKHIFFGRLIELPQQQRPDYFRGQQSPTSQNIIISREMGSVDERGIVSFDLDEIESYLLSPNPYRRFTAGTDSQLRIWQGVLDMLNREGLTIDQLKYVADDLLSGIFDAVPRRSTLNPQEAIRVKGMLSAFYQTRLLGREGMRSHIGLLAVLYSFIYRYENAVIPQQLNASPAMTTELQQRSNETVSDPVGASEAVDPVGGIDLNSANLNLMIKRDGKGVPLPMSQQDIALFEKIDGLSPVIIAINPALDLPILNDLK